SHWSVSGDALHLVLVPNNTDIIIYNTTTARHALDVGFDYSAAAATGLSYVTQLVDGNSGLSRHISCGLRHDTDWRELIRFQAPATYTQLVPNDTGEPIAVPGSYRTILVMDPGTETCTMTATQPHVLMGNSPSDGNTYIGLRVFGAAVAFRYVAI